MKLIKTGSKDNYLETEPFNFKKVQGLDKFDVLTSFVTGVSPEYQNDMDKLLMVVEGSISLKVDKQNAQMNPGDMILIKCGERFSVNANHGAKLMQFNPELPGMDKVKFMDYA